MVAGMKKREEKRGEGDIKEAAVERGQKEGTEMKNRKEKRGEGNEEEEQGEGDIKEAAVERGQRRRGLE